MILVILIVLGLCFGSFIEATTWRLHEQDQSHKKRSIADNKKLSIVQGRSMCANCSHELAWYDLIPLVSWMTLQGKCRYCRKSIGWQAPMLELATAIMFLLSYLFWPSGLHSLSSKADFALWLLLLVGFIILFIYDMRWMILPDRVVYPLVILATIRLLVRILFLGGNKSILVGAILGILCLAGLFFLLFQVSQGKWIGGGDVKLGVVLGLVAASPLLSVLLLFIASSMGSLVAIPLLFTKKLGKSSKLPFGPLLIGAAIVVQLFGLSLVHWYKLHILGLS